MPPNEETPGSSGFPKAGGGTRTHGRLITNQVLCQLSYSGV